MSNTIGKTPPTTAPSSTGEAPQTTPRTDSISAAKPDSYKQPCASKTSLFLDKIEQQLIQEIETATPISIQEKIDWIGKLQTPLLASPRSKKVVALIFESVTTTEDMTKLVTCLEIDRDNRDLTDLTRRFDLNDDVTQHISHLLPEAHVAWFGDDIQGDLQAALILSQKEESKDRVVSFIRMAKSTPDSFEKILADIHSVEQTEGLEPPFTGTTFADIKSYLASRHIMIYESSEKLDDIVRIYFGQNPSDSPTPFLVASDIDDTTITGYGKNAELIPGHAEAIRYINDQNQNTLPLDNNGFFYAISARPQAFQRGTVNLLGSLGKKTDGKPYQNFSVKAGTWDDLIWRIQGLGEMCREMAQTKTDHVLSLLDLWSHKDPSKHSAERAFYPITKSADAKPSDANMTGRPAPEHPQAKVVAYGNFSYVIPGQETAIRAKLEYGDAPSGLASDVKFKSVLIQLNNAKGDIYDPQGALVATHLSDHKYQTTSGQIFVKDDQGQFFLEDGSASFKPCVIENYFDSKTNEHVAQINPDGTLEFFQSSGNPLTLTVHNGSWYKPDDSGFTNPLFTRALDGSLHDKNGFPLTLNLKTDFAITGNQESTNMKRLIDELKDTWTIAQTNEDGMLRFNDSLPNLEAPQKNYVLNYQLSDGRPVQGSTKVFPVAKIGEGEILKPIIVIDFDFLDSLKKDDLPQWMNAIKGLMHSNNYQFQYITRRDDSLYKEIQEKITLWGLDADCPIRYQDTHGFEYSAIENRSKKAGVRNIEDLIVGGRDQGLPFLALITDSPEGIRAAHQSDTMLLNSPRKCKDPTLQNKLNKRSADFTEAQKLTGNERIKWRTLNNSSNRLDEHRVNATVTFDGPTALHSQLDAVDSLNAGDLLFFEMFEYHMDEEVGKPLYDRIERAANRGVQIYLQLDCIGSIFVIPAYKKLAKAHSNITLTIQPLFKDGGPAHINHKKRLIAIHRENGVPVQATTFIGGRNWSKSYFTNPNPFLGANNYKALSKTEARYDSTVKVDNLLFALENMWDVIETMNNNDHDKKDHSGRDFFKLIFGKETFPQFFNGKNFLDYREFVAPVLQNEFDKVSEPNPIHEAKTREDLAKYYFKNYSNYNSRPFAQQFEAWSYFHMAKTILQDIDNKKLAYSPEKYAAKYQETLAQLAQNPSQQTTESADNPGSTFDPNDHAIDEAKIAAQNLSDLKAIDIDKEANDATLSFKTEFLAGYRLTTSHLKTLAESHRQQALSEAYKVYNHYQFSPGPLSNREMGEKKAAINFIIQLEAPYYLHLLNDFTQWCEAEPNHHFVKQFKDHGGARAMAQYWQTQKGIVSPAIRADILKMVATAYLAGDHSFSLDAFKEEPTIDENQIRESYKQAWADALNAEKTLVTETETGRLLDGRSYAQKLIANSENVANEQDWGTRLACNKFLSIAKEHTGLPMERSPQGFYFDDLEATSVDHDGANKWDFKTARQFKILTSQTMSIFFSANNFPPDRDVVEELIAAKKANPNKRIMFVTGPSNKSLDKVKRAAIQTLIANGVEVWFTPTQQMHIKMALGMNGSHNVDYWSRNNDGEIVFVSTDSRYVNRVVNQHLLPYLTARCIPLHLMSTWEDVDKALDYAGEEPFTNPLDIPLDWLENAPL